MKKDIVLGSLIFGAIAVVQFLLYKLGSHPFYLSKDHMTYTYPMLAAIGSYLKQGQFPLWFSEIFMGDALFLAGAYDAKVIPFLVFLKPLDAMVFMPCLHAFLGGLIFVKMARKVFAVSLLAAVIGAIFYVYNGFLVWYYQDGPYGPICLWVAAEILALVSFNSRPWLSLAVIALCVADQMQTGRFETVELAYAALVVFVVAYNVSRTRGKNLKVIRRSLRVIPVFGVGILLGILLEFPFFWDQMSSITSSTRFGIDVPIAQYPFAILNFFSLIPDSIQFFHLSSGIDHRSYIGFLGLFLIVMAVGFSPNIKRVWVFLGIAVFLNFFLYDFQFFGKLNLFRDVYKAIPGHRGIRYSIRFLPFVFLFLSVVLMEGVGALQQLALQSEKKIRWLALLFLGITVFFTAWIVLRHPVAVGYPDKATCLFRILLMNVAGFALLTVFPKRPALFGTYVSVSYLASIYLVNTMMGGGPPMQLYDQIYKKGATEYEAFFQNMPRHQFRVATVPVGEDITTPLNTSLGIQGLSGYYMLVGSDKIAYASHVLRGSTYGEFHLREESPVLGGYSLTNVKYFVMENKPTGKVGLWLSQNPWLRRAAVLPERGVEIYENPKALPRAYLVNQFEVVPPVDTMHLIGERVEKNFDWFQSAVVLNDTPMGKMDRSQSPGTVVITSYQNSEVVLKASTGSGALLVLADHFQEKRWKASVDENTVPVYRANGIFRALYVPQGEHRIRFYYDIPRWQIAIVWVGLSLIGLLLLLSRSKWAHFQWL